MNRREVIGRLVLMLGGSIIGAEFFLSGCKPDPTKINNLFTEDDMALFNEIGETILPETATPGAKMANVGAFMALMVNDCYTPEEQKTFTNGVTELNDRSKEQYGKDFMGITANQRTELLTVLDLEQKKEAKINQHTIHYFRMMKELTLLGYFSSEMGCTKAMRYIPVPGKYISCIPYRKGEKSWAT
jgi:hypothetical protein